MRATKQKEKEEVGGEEEEVSRGARGQLIVSGNVFHLHVYTVNSGEQGGGGLGVSTARHSLLPFPYGLAIVVHQQTEQEKKERKDREKEFSFALFSLSEMMTSGRDDSSEPPACHCTASASRGPIFLLHGAKYICE